MGLLRKQVKGALEILQAKIRRLKAQRQVRRLHMSRAFCLSWSCLCVVLSLATLSKDIFAHPLLICALNLRHYLCMHLS
jgi:hypothetical protein